MPPSEIKVRVQITQFDIDNGTPNCKRACPTALALLRAVPDSRHPVVDIFRAMIVVDDRTYTSVLPNELTDWIRSYDASHEVVEPAEFDLTFHIYPRID
jgi:hypothetical protein